MLDGDRKADVAIIGGGFTGISAALHLAEAGATVVLLEANAPGWGASGRNGGFCCLGGSMATEQALTRRFGQAAAEAYWQAEEDAVSLVAELLTRFAIQADVHSKGETQLAHRPRDMDRLRRKADEMAQGSGPDPILTEPGDLLREGFGGPFHGALTTPVGFGLNPRKYLFGIAAAAVKAGAALMQDSAVTGLERTGAGWQLRTRHGTVAAAQVRVATNG